MTKKNNKLKILFVFLFMIFALVFSISYVSGRTSQELVAIEESEEHRAWAELSDEEKEQTIEPAYSSINFIQSVKRSTYNTLLKASTTTSIGTSYDLRTALNSIIVKNQEITGSCWAFAGSSMIETSIAKTYNKTSSEYSPMHMDYYTANIYNREVGDGGNFNILLAYLANGYGPVYESDLPFSSVYDVYTNTDSEYGLAAIENVDTSQETKAKVSDVTLFASIYKSYDSSTGTVTYKDSSSYFGATTYTTDEVEAMRNLIKQHIQEDGAVEASFYSDIQVDSEGNYSSKGGYYNPETNAYYYDGSKSMNHAVTIVGWDDNYSKTNFAEDNQPANDGAYIVLNSYGEEFGENGYMYVSYDDAIIEKSILGIDSVIEYSEESKDYDTQYTRSELGMNIAADMVNSSATAYLSTIYAANVYQRENSTQYEYLTKVGLYIYETEGVEIYIDSDDALLDDYTLVSSYTGSEALTPGYHTIDITPQQLTGDEFAIVIKYIKNDDNTGGANLPLECNYTNSGISDTITIFDTVTSQVGESYISEDGETWVDMYGYNLIQSASTTYTLKDTNACIDAYTILQEAPIQINVTGVSLNKISEELYVGQTSALIATVTPDNATNQNITWTSSDTSVASVSDSGVVTAISAGTATITVTTEDGGFTATCEITVEEEEIETVNVTGVILNKSSETIKVGENLSLIATVTPDNATNQNITWTSSNNSVATVSGGVVTAVAEGTTLITVTTEDGGYAATCSVTVEKAATVVETINVTSVSLNVSNVELEIGDVYTFVATLNPSNATNKNVTWTSSDESIIKISDNGILTTVAEGTATITVTTEDGGYTATATITVTEKTNMDDDIYTDTDNDNNDDNDNDNTVVSGSLPYTGEKIIMIGLILIVFITGTICIIKIIKYNVK